ncbi:GerAB/ArcD/ProY family transporter [Desulfotomaculum nigrificans]|uniref:GerAB/ArcD/ProY family transporter n=1 Tax=Desulfotomaculum nigrificans TaxID=1565 RepID=UPI0001FAEACB|nr:endospore germination permease [Desulfotomaculum nigrificans]
MREEGKISAYQAMVYQVSIVLATAILFVPTITTRHAKQDAWLSVIMACIFGCLQVCTAVSLSRRFPNASVVQYTPLILGKVPGKVVGFVYLFYFFYVGYFILQEFAALMCSSYMLRTPSIVFMLVLSLLAAYAAYGGLEVICRTSSIVLTVVMATLVLIAALIIKDIKIWRFLPVLENGFGPMLLGAISPGGWFGETAVILMLYPFINNKEKVVKTSFLAILILFITMEVVVTGAIGLLGPTETASFLFPTFNMARRIKLEALPFLERLDALFMMVWVAAMLIKLTTFFFAGVLALSQWLNVKDYRPLILPSMAIMVALAVQAWKNITELFTFSREVFPLTIIFVNFIITFFLLIIAGFRNISTRNT